MGQIQCIIKTEISQPNYGIYFLSINSFLEIVPEFIRCFSLIDPKPGWLCADAGS